MTRDGECDSPQEYRILLMGDGCAGASNLRCLLERHGCRVRESDFESVLDAFEPDDFDVVLIGNELARSICAPLCLKLRERGLEAAVVVFSPAENDDCQLAALRSGADDYLLGTTSTDVLIERILVNARRARSRGMKSSDRFSLRVPSGTLTLAQGLLPVFNGVPLEVSPVQARLLRILLEASDPLSTQDLGAAGWPGARVAPHTVHTHIALLRTRLKDLGARIVYVRGKGYRLAR
jgi:DNA-binding response OmpR family regulator